MDCKHCNKEIHSKFCPDCGHPASLQRIDGKYILHEIEHVLEFERGILFTIRALTTHPGLTIRNYLSENRSRLVKPLLFIIITSVLYTFLDHFFHIEDGYVSYKETSGEHASAISTIVQWVQEHYGYANIMMGIFIALWLKLFFRKSDFNFFEILIMLCFVMGIGMLIFSVFVIIQGLTHVNVMTFAGIIGVAYCVWAIGQFYDKKKIVNYCKALVAYLLGMITFWIFPVLIGTIIDFINKQ